MAALENIRKRGVALTIIIGLAMLAFIIGGLDFNSLFSSSRTLVGEVNGEELQIQESEKRMEEMRTFYKMEMGQSSLSEQESEQIQYSVWNTWLKEQLYGQQCQLLGITITEQELQDRLSATNPHPMLQQFRMFYNQEKGGFDPSALTAVLQAVDQDENSDIAKYWSFVYRMVKDRMLEEKYMALVGTSYQVNNLEAEHSYKSRRTFDIDFVQTPYYTIADSTLNVADKDLKAKFESTKNLYRVAEDSRTLAVVAFPIEPSQDDDAEVKDWIEKLREPFFTSADFIELSNENSDVQYKGMAQSASQLDADLKDFALSGQKDAVFGPVRFGKTYKMARIVEAGIMAPDSVKVRHIMLQKETAERTEAVADSLLQLLATGADFATLAKDNSLAGTSQNGGEIGWMREGDVDKDFSTTCFAAAINKPFVYHFGQTVHVVEVTEKTANVQKVKLCVLQRDVEPSSTTYSQIFNQASQYIAQNNSLAEFEEGADAAAGQFVRTYELTKNDARVADFSDSRGIVRWAFEQDEPGDVSDKVYECGDKFVVVALKQVKEAGIPTIEQVKPQLENAVRNDMKYARIQADYMDQLQKGADLSALGSVGQATGLSATSAYINGLGNEPALCASMASAKLGEVRVFQGANAAIAARLTSLSPEEGTYDAASEMMQLAQRKPYAYLLFDMLKNKADLTDNRIKFY